MCPQTADALPVDARILVAGCGTGRQAAALALAYPDATLTAIDISQASIDYAEKQCRSLGLHRIEFRKLDLYEAAQLVRPFDAIFCAGVLHHLPDPERGLEVLASMLRPGGVMNIAVYTKIARLFIAGARKFVADLAATPVSDDLLREARRRFLDSPDQPLMNSITWGPEFGTLIGVYDLLLHRHEDPFDIPRIEQALQRARLKILSIVLPSPLHQAQYDAMFPQDPGRRDFRAWAIFEARHPRAFAGMCQFWCRSEDGKDPS
jgi:SAM-dependent methyltransferase